MTTDEIKALGAIERYDALADAFYRETGIWPPGRSSPMECGEHNQSDEERFVAWYGWVTLNRERVLKNYISSRTDCKNET